MMGVRTLRVAWYADPSVAWDEFLRLGSGNRRMLTLDMVANFAELSLRRELYLVGKDTAGRGRPVRSEAVVTGDPFCADVCVDLDAVRLAVVGRGGDGVV